MPNKPAYPVTADLSQLLTSTGLPFVATGNDQGIFGLPDTIAASVEEFEKRTLWTPYLGAQQVRYFDPQGANTGGRGIGFGGWSGLVGRSMGGSNVLFLGAGLLTLNSLTTDLTHTNTTGTVLTLGDDFWLEPTSAAGAGMPSLSIKFRFPVYGEPQSIKIDAVWGRALTIPYDAWFAILQYSAFLLLPQLGLQIHGGLDSWTEAGVSEKYGVQLAKIGEQWEGNFCNTAKRYRRISL